MSSGGEAIEPPHGELMAELLRSLRTLLEGQRRIEARLGCSAGCNENVEDKESTEILGKTRSVACRHSHMTIPDYQLGEDEEGDVAEPREKRPTFRLAGSISLSRSCSAPAPATATELDSPLRADSSPVSSRRVRSRPTLTLPGMWPQTIQLRRGMASGQEKINLEITEICDAEEQDGEEHTHSSLHRTASSFFSVRQRNLIPNSLFMLAPYSKPRAFMDAGCVLVLLFDLFSLPYLLAFDVTFDGPLVFLTNGAVGYWILDMLLSFRTGYYSNGELEMRPGKVFKHYVKGTFVLDLGLVIIDVTSACLNVLNAPLSGSDSITALRVFKISRLLRILDVMRAQRLADAIESLCMQTPLFHASFILMLSNAKLVCAILWLNHLIACLWYMIGRQDFTDTNMHWIDMPTGAEDGSSYKDTGNLYRYATCLHWSMTQMTPGSMQVSPVNSLERIFNLICLLFGLLVFSTLISSISAAMMTFKNQVKENTSMVATLQRFLTKNGVSTALAMSVRKQVREKLRRKKTLLIQDVQALDLVSISLRGKLQEELCRPYLARHAYFRSFMEIDSAATEQLCRTCTDFVGLANGDTLFLAGAEAKEAHVVISGCLTYIQDPKSSRVEEITNTTVEPGQWLCEAALWCHWRHVGVAEVALTSSCELLSVRADDLLKVLDGRGPIRQTTWAYAQSFHTFLINSRPPKSEWPTDLSLPVHSDDVIFSMAREAKVVLGLAAVQVIKSSPNWWRRARLTRKLTRELEKEVRSGRSTLLLTEDRDGVQRMIALVALKVQRADGRLLVQLGKWHDGQVEVICKLPAVKQLAGEDVDAALERLLADRLGPFSGGVAIASMRMEMDDHLKISDHFGIKTRYFRTVAHFSWDEDFNVTTPAVVPREQFTFLGGNGSWQVHEQPQVFALPSGEIVAWLTPAQFENYSGGSGQWELEQWLGIVREHISASAA